MNDCPRLSSKAVAHYREEMKSYMQRFRASGKSQHQANYANGKIDGVGGDGHEVAFVGDNYTFHTHPSGQEPSAADFQANMRLNKRFACIGHSPTGKIFCYDLAKMGKRTCTF